MIVLLLHIAQKNFSDGISLEIDSLTFDSMPCWGGKMTLEDNCFILLHYEYELNFNKKIIIIMIANTIKYGLRTTRKAKFYKPKHYQAIPPYMQPLKYDIHDTYQLRSYEEVDKEVKSL